MLGHDQCADTHLVVQLLPVETLQQILLGEVPEVFGGPHMGLLLKQLL